MCPRSQVDALLCALIILATTASVTAAAKSTLSESTRNAGTADFVLSSRRSLLQQQILPRIPLLSFLNPNLRAAYFVFKEWKEAITSDPNGITETWEGFDVCEYKGVFCAPPLDASCELVVAGIDLNHANIAGTLPEKLGLLKHLALFHINSNRFTGTLPDSISQWSLLYELDISNNLFEGPFPQVLLCLPSLAFVDLRFNRFEGALPAEIFELQTLDALFVNDNMFGGMIPRNLGSSPVSVAVFARNLLEGSIPSSISQMGGTLNEVIFMGNSFTGCVPPEIGSLRELTVLDMSFNNLSGEIPPSISELMKLEQLNLAANRLSGVISSAVCKLPSLRNFTAAANFFFSEDPTCATRQSTGTGRVVFDDSGNCIQGRQQQSFERCCAFFATEQFCTAPPPPTYGYVSPPPPSLAPYVYGSPPLP